MARWPPPAAQEPAARRILLVRPSSLAIRVRTLPATGGNTSERASLSQVRGEGSAGGWLGAWEGRRGGGVARWPPPAAQEPAVRRILLVRPSPTCNQVRTLPATGGNTSERAFFSLYLTLGRWWGGSYGGGGGGRCVVPSSPSLTRSTSVPCHQASEMKGSHVPQDSSKLLVGVTWLFQALWGRLPHSMARTRTRQRWPLPLPAAASLRAPSMTPCGGHRQQSRSLRLHFS